MINFNLGNFVIFRLYREAGTWLSCSYVDPPCFGCYVSRDGVGKGFSLGVILLFLMFLF